MLRWLSTLFFPPCPLGVRVCFWGFLFLYFLRENVDDAGYFVRKPRIDGVNKTDILTKQRMVMKENTYIMTHDSEVVTVSVSY